MIYNTDICSTLAYADSTYRIANPYLCRKSVCMQFFVSNFTVESLIQISKST